MKIAVNYNNSEDVMSTIAIAEAFYDSLYKIKLKFNDDSSQTVDFELFLQKSQHPSIRKYLDLEFFKKFSIVHGNLNWNDYDLIFPIWDLYEGKSS